MPVSTWETRLYPSKLKRDPVAIFLSYLDRYVNPESRVLDLGAGSGINRYTLRGKVREVVGVDFDERVATNPLVDRGIVVKPGRLPFPDEAFDVVFCIYVLEHVTDPTTVIAEITRILRPGGIFLALTPNRRHYVPMVARLTPTRFHKWLNKRRGREEEDTFPTVYRMNTPGALRRWFAHGFDCVAMQMIEVAPHYLKFWTPAFILGALYERLVNAFEWLAPFRVNIIFVCRKRGGDL